MSVAIRTITRLQDADDVNVTPAVGVDEYVLTYDHDTAKFVLRAPATPFDGTPYALLAGRAGGQTIYGGTAANDDLTLHGTSDGTRTTSYVLLQPTAGNVGIGTTAPGATLDIRGSFNLANVATPTTSLMSAVAAGGDTGTYIRLNNNNASVGIVATAIQMSTWPTGVTAQIGSGWENNTWTNFLSFHTTNDYGVTLPEQMRISGAGNVGIGTAAPATLLHAVSTTATTNALRNVLTLGANVTSTGVGAAGLGPAILFTAESSTTADTTQARIAALWNDHTHSQFKSDLVGYASDAAGEREIWRGRANGSAPALGVLGATPIARKLHVADPAGGATVDAEARAAINAILVSLEDFGFHATS